MADIVIYVSKQTLGESILGDVASALTLGGPVLLNELTLQSTTLNFLFGAIALLVVFARAITLADKTRIRGKTADEIVAKVRKRLEVTEG